MDLQAVFRRVDEAFDETVRELVRFCAQPSISVQGVGIAEMSALVADRFTGLGAKVSLHTFDGGNPVVFARFDAVRPRTLLFYNHYDVQPPEPLDRWVTAPFEPTIRDGAIYARGAADNKGALVARLAAIRAFLDVHGELPVNVRYVAEGEEEVGSPHLQPFVDANRDQLGGDGVIWEEASADQAGTPVIRLGNKGSLYVELRAKGPSADAHARFGAIFPNPIWKLTWALSVVRSPDGRVLVPGFYESVIPPSHGEDALYEQLAPNAGPLLQRYGLSTSFPAREPKAVMAELYGKPTCTLCGIGGGYAGPGSKTIVPAEAFAKLEFKLVPNQDPDILLESLRGHLAEHGFGDIEVSVHSRGFPSKTPLDHPFAALVKRTGELVYGRPLTVEPTSSGTGPRYVLTRWSSMPIVAIGVSHAGSMIHGPNENIRLDHFRGHIKHIVALMHTLAREYAA